MTARSFLFASERTLRAPWRILIFIGVAVLALVVTNVLAAALVPATASVAARSIVGSWAGVLGVLAATYVSLRWVDGRGWEMVRLDAAAARPELLGAGALMGAAAIGVPSIALLLVHDLRVVPDVAGSWFGTAGLAVLLLLPAALTEELLLRGYIFAVLRETVGWRWTLIGTSVVFGLLHLNNPGAEPEPIVLVIVAGFFLGAILLVTESLYAAWMAHFAWNWVMAGALHTAVSGLGIATANYRVVDRGPAWLTGGAWGPEGGVAAGLGMFAFLFYLVGRHLHRLERTNG